MDYWKINFIQSFKDTWFVIGDAPLVTVLFSIGVFVLTFKTLKSFQSADVTREKVKETIVSFVILLFCSAVVFVFCVFFVSPTQIFNQQNVTITGQSNIISMVQKQLDDKSPKLDGYINQTLIADEPGTTNSLVFLQVTVGNSGGSASVADDFKLTVMPKKRASTNAEPIDFTDEYKINTFSGGKPYLIDLKRPQLISEKSIKAIQPGESLRGWIAYRFRGITSSQYQYTNLVLSFLDIHDKKTTITNGFWNGKPSTDWETEETTKTLPGSESLMIPIEPPVVTNTGWLPPELPPGCSNVLVFFGANGMNYSRIMAEISPEGTKFAIKDLPDFYLQNLDKSPGYSPRQKYMWIKDSMAFSIGGRTVPYPVQPIIISNRLYVEVEIPFLNEKRKIVMSDDFDPDLPIPPQWDRNYSTNYYANGVVSGGIYAYEVVNELTNPVLQVGYSAPNEVHVTGIFKVDENSILVSFGQQPMLLTLTNRVFTGLESTQRITTVSLEGTNFSEVLQIYTNDSISSIGEMITNEFYRPIFPGQRTIFKYPSNRNLGVFNDETNALH